MRLKRWESPRRRGRNDKGKGGAARQRQLKKQQQMMRKKLKGEPIQSHKHKPKNPKKSSKIHQEGRDAHSLPSFCLQAEMSRGQLLHNFSNPRSQGNPPSQKGSRIGAIAVS